MRLKNTPKQKTEGLTRQVPQPGQQPIHGFIPLPDGFPGPVEFEKADMSEAGDDEDFRLIHGQTLSSDLVLHDVDRSGHDLEDGRPPCLFSLGKEPGN